MNLPTIIQMAPAVTDNSSRLEHVSISLVISGLSDHGGQPLAIKKTWPLFPICTVMGRYLEWQIDNICHQRRLGIRRQWCVWVFRVQVFLNIIFYKHLKNCPYFNRIKFFKTNERISKGTKTTTNMTVLYLLAALVTTN